MLTVKVCPLMLATPRVAVAVSNDCLNPPTDTVMDECAGQYVLGVNCILLSAGHENVPAGAVVIFGDENSMVRSARPRSATGRMNVTVTGIPTPTAGPPLGVIVATGRPARVDASRAARCVTSASARSNISIIRMSTVCIVISTSAARSCPAA